MDSGGVIGIRLAPSTYAVGKEGSRRGEMSESGHDVVVRGDDRGRDMGALVGDRMERKEKETLRIYTTSFEGV